MATLTRTDPLRDFKFSVKITPDWDTNNTKGWDFGFAAVSDLVVNNDMIPYREGGMNTHMHKMVGMSDYPDITFSRGVFAGSQSELQKWQEWIHSYQQADGATGDDNYRATIKVTVYDHPYTGAAYDSSGAATSTGISYGHPKLRYTLYNCWPAGYAISGLSATQSGILVQQMTMHHEGYTIDWNPTST